MQLYHGDPPVPWNTGSAPLYLDAVGAGGRIKVGVYCGIEGLKEPLLALLDTGAEWSLVGGESAEILMSKFDTQAARWITMNTYRGLMEGPLIRTNVVLVASEGLEFDLVTPATVMLDPHWSGPTVLGWRGFLERIRMALDPGLGPGDSRFSFGKPGLLGGG